jgi:Middle or third domain of peptidase_M16
MLKKSPFSRLWYKRDTMFFTPKAYVRINFNCPESNHSPESSVLTKMFTRLLMDYLNEYGEKYYMQMLLVCFLSKRINPYITHIRQAIMYFNHSHSDWFCVPILFFINFFFHWHLKKHHICNKLIRQDIRH